MLGLDLREVTPININVLFLFPHFTGYGASTFVTVAGREETLLWVYYFLSWVAKLINKGFFFFFFGS